MASIAKRSDGRWRARYRDETGREHARHFDRKIDAQRWLDGVTATVVSGTYVDPRAGKVTFTAFYREWSARQVWVPATRANADHAVATVSFRDLPLAALRRSHLESWVKEMSARLAPTTIKTRFVIVRSVLRAAVADRIIGTDPSEGVTLPRRRKAEAAMQVPTVETVGQLVAAAEPDFRAYVALCAFAGLRMGEAAGVQVADIDFLRRRLTVSRQLQRDGRGVAVVPPKYGSERVVYLPDEVLAVLSAHVADHTPAGEPTRWLFTAYGRPLHNNAVTYRWRQTRKRAGAEDVRLHEYADLRVMPISAPDRLLWLASDLARSA